MPPKRKAAKEDTVPSKKKKVTKTPPKRKSAKGGTVSSKKKGKNAASMSSEKPQNTKKGSPSKKSGKKASISLASLVTEQGWQDRLNDEFEKDYFVELEERLSKEYAAGAQIFPPQNLIFNMFTITPFDEVKVVLLGQDPYHDDGQAHGLSFSVPAGIKIPSSLRNVFKELSTDIPGFSPPEDGDLTSWARQGMLLLNATLTVEAHKPNSHAKFGWQTFTDHVIKLLSDEKDGLVFILWGGFAHKKEALIDCNKHRVIKTAHPSGLSWSKFCGCKCFSKTNDALRALGKPEILWSI